VNNFKKIELIKKHLFAAVKEASENSHLEEIRTKLKQTIRSLEEIEKRLEKNKKKEEKLKNSQKTFKPQNVLKIIDSEIERQKKEIDNLEQRSSKKEGEDIQTFLD
jgi:hypothetical protein